MSHYRSLTAISFALMIAFAAGSGIAPDAHARSASASISSIHLAHGTIKATQSNTLTLTAVDLAGKPMYHASVVAVMRYGSTNHHYTLPRTSKSGVATLKFTPPKGSHPGKVSVHVTVSNGNLSIPLSTSFTIAGKVPISSAILAFARALPSTVTAPAPVYVLVYAHNKAGASWPDAGVYITVTLGTLTVHITGKTGLDGVATFTIGTAPVAAKQAVKATILVKSGKNSTRLSVTFTVNAPSPTPTPTKTSSVVDPPSPAAAPTPTLLSTPTPTPTPTPAPAATPTSTPTLDPPSVAPTSTPTPSDTPTPTNTPTDTPTDTPTPTATPTDTPTDTPTPMPDCGAVNTDQTGCQQEVLNLVNAERQEYAQQYGESLGNLTLDATQSNGTGGCVGSIGHSEAMQESGTIWHQNVNYPAASFFADICGGFNAAGENVGEFGGGNELSSIQSMNDEMMSEPDSPSLCQTGDNHACNIVNANFRRIGIGLVDVGGTTWLTEDFMG